MKETQDIDLYNGFVHTRGLELYTNMNPPTIIKSLMKLVGSHDNLPLQLEVNGLTFCW